MSRGGINDQNLRIYPLLKNGPRGSASSPIFFPLRKVASKGHDKQASTAQRRRDDGGRSGMIITFRSESTFSASLASIIDETRAIQTLID